MTRLLRSAALLALGLFAFAAAGAHAQGVLSFDADTYDFGTLNEGDKPVYVFAFTNVGDAPLRLTNVQPSCGCTTPSYTTDEVQPGGRGEITVEYDSEGRPGEFNKSIAVRAEGADPDYVTLRINGVVTPKNIQNGVTQGGVMFDTDVHTYPSLKPDEPANHVFKMQNTGARPIRIESARAYAGGVEVAFPDRPVFPDEVVEVTVTVTDVAAAADARGAMDVAVVLVTTDADQPTKSLRLRGTVEADRTASTE